VHVINSPKPGLVSALNSGLEIASGKYIARIDADYVMFPGRLQLQFDYLEIHTYINVLGTDVIEIDAEGKEIGSSYM
jgi:glycosyltransferase involved in cell wall biosynthesis